MFSFEKCCNDKVASALMRTGCALGVIAVLLPDISGVATWVMMAVSAAIILAACILAVRSGFRKVSTEGPEWLVPLIDRMLSYPYYMLLLCIVGYQWEGGFARWAMFAVLTLNALIDTFSPARSSSRG